MIEYEYRLIAMAVDDAHWQDRTPRSHAEALMESWNEDFPALLEALNSKDDGGWEPFSHDILPLPDGAVISVWVRRESI